MREPLRPARRGDCGAGAVEVNGDEPALTDTRGSALPRNLPDAPEAGTAERIATPASTGSTPHQRPAAVFLSRGSHARGQRSDQPGCLLCVTSRMPLVGLSP